MTIDLSKEQAHFIDAYKKRYGCDDTTVMYRALSALSAREGKQWKAHGGIKRDELNEIIDAWCQKHHIDRHGTSVNWDEDGGWLLGWENFSVGENEDFVFPRLRNSFREFMRAYGLWVEEVSYGCCAITEQCDSFES